MPHGRPFNIPAKNRWDQGFGVILIGATYGNDGFPTGGVRVVPFGQEASAQYGADRATMAGYPSTVVRYGAGLFGYIRTDDLEYWQEAVIS